ncbi:hypothetical protein OS493_038689 [Desmophyllum pertusum]|uniref:Uncharacterized protein n=1 Tax=Desmophyllum pertusum TaxID=174260 RepID=A0A9W9Z942_9CNID|nr:hypothetical protein OS493_038689 [Desmophyllum pertusum]
MGSCSSKARSIRDGSNLREECKDETNRGVEDEHPSAATMSSEMAENTTTRGTPTQRMEANPALVPQAMNPLQRWVDIVLNTTTKELKAKGKRPKEGSSGRETSNVLKYSNAKYLKSWQQLPTLLSSANTTRQAQGDASTSSSSSSSGYGVNKEKSNQARQPEPGNISEASSSRGGRFPVGFGAVGNNFFRVSLTVLGQKFILPGTVISLWIKKKEKRKLFYLRRNANDIVVYACELS